MRNEGDLHPFRDLFDAAIRHSSTRLTCPRCRRVAVLPTAGLWRVFNRNGWDDRFQHVQRRLFCQLCWRRHNVKVRARMLRPGYGAKFQPDRARCALHEPCDSRQTTSTTDAPPL